MPAAPDPFPDQLFHAAPLHYLPRILHDGALYAQSVLRLQGIRPRATACRRDRMLGLADFVHLSLTPQTPMLADKARKGYPHVLLIFDRAAVLNLPCVALVPYNAKAWHAKAAFAPVTERAAQDALLAQFAKTGRPRSLAVLVKYGLSLTHTTGVVFVCDAHRQAAQELVAALRLSPPAPLVTNATLFPPGGALADAATLAYFADCWTQRSLRPPPLLPFD